MSMILCCCDKCTLTINYTVSHVSGASDSSSYTIKRRTCRLWVNSAVSGGPAVMEFDANAGTWTGAAPLRYCLLQVVGTFRRYVAGLPTGTTQALSMFLVTAGDCTSFERSVPPTTVEAVLDPGTATWAVEVTRTTASLGCPAGPDFTFTIAPASTGTGWASTTSADIMPCGGNVTWRLDNVVGTVVCCSDACTGGEDEFEDVVGNCTGWTGHDYDTACGTGVLSVSTSATINYAGPCSNLQCCCWTCCALCCYPDSTLEVSVAGLASGTLPVLDGSCSLNYTGSQFIDIQFTPPLDCLSTFSIRLVDEHGVEWVGGIADVGDHIHCDLKDGFCQSPVATVTDVTFASDTVPPEFLSTTVTFRWTNCWRCIWYAELFRFYRALRAPDGTIIMCTLCDDYAIETATPQCVRRPTDCDPLNTWEPQDGYAVVDVELPDSCPELPEIDGFEPVIIRKRYDAVLLGDACPQEFGCDCSQTQAPIIDFPYDCCPACGTVSSYYVLFEFTAVVDYWSTGGIRSTCLLCVDSIARQSVAVGPSCGMMPIGQWAMEVLGPADPECLGPPPPGSTLGAVTVRGRRYVSCGECSDALDPWPPISCATVPSDPNTLCIEAAVCGGLTSFDCP